MGAQESAEASYPSNSSSFGNDTDDSFSFSSMEDVLSPDSLVRVQRCGLEHDLELLEKMNIRPKNRDEAAKMVDLASTFRRNNPSQCQQCPGGSLSPDMKQSQSKKLERIINKVETEGVESTIKMSCHQSDASDQGINWNSPSTSKGGNCVDVLTFTIKRSPKGSFHVDLVSRGMSGLTITGHNPGMERIQKIIENMPSFDDQVAAMKSLTMSAPCASYSNVEFQNLFEDLMERGYSITSDVYDQ